jgi:hypothetical protein
MHTKEVNRAHSEADAVRITILANPVKREPPPHRINRGTHSSGKPYSSIEQANQTTPVEPKKKIK